LGTFTSVPHLWARWLLWFFFK